jgi:hypothetical protein
MQTQGMQAQGMQASIFLARIIGPLLVTIGIGMLVNGPVYQTMAVEFLHSHALIYLSGLLVLVGGLALVNVHRAWGLQWPVIITLFGWLMVIGGIVRILAPQFVETVGLAILTGAGVMTGAGIAVLALGGFLSFKGYSQ